MAAEVRESRSACVKKGGIVPALLSGLERPIAVEVTDELAFG